MPSPLCPATHAAPHIEAHEGRVHNPPEEDYRTGLGLFDSPDLGVRYADVRAGLSDAPLGVFDSPDAASGRSA
jgi:hypothetical protein